MNFYENYLVQAPPLGKGDSGELSRLFFLIY